jgi:simple sugar transport system ATP-binding protein
MMIGKEFDRPQRAAVSPGETVLALHQCSKVAGAPFGVDLHDINLSVRAGEILGIAGISGNGQNELCELLSGEVLADSADAIELLGIPIGLASVGARRAQGLAYVPEDRLSQGSVTSMSLAENLMLTGANTLGLVKSGMLQLSRAVALTRDCIGHFNVKASGPHAAAGSLSGGNLQKFIAGREMLQKPKVMICAQPTWGVDVGATAFIRQSLIDLARAGCAVIVISEELEELFEVSDRIAVLSQGRLSPIKPLSETSVEQIGLWMGGMWQEGANATA